MVSLSATGVAAYQTCATKYMFTRVDRWTYDGPRKPGKMELGSLTHHLIYRRLSGMPEENMLQEAETWIVENYDDEYSRQAAHREHIGYALAMTNQTMLWFEHNNFWDTWEIVSREKRYDVVIERYTITFQPDLILKHKVVGHYGILDFKTAATTTETLHANDWQMNVMGVGLEELGMHPYYGMHLRIKRVKSSAAKPPFVEKHEMRYSAKRLEIVRNQLLTLAGRIETDHVYLPSPSWTCDSMCAFRGPCEARSAGQDWEYIMMQTHKKKPKEIDV